MESVSETSAFLPRIGCMWGFSADPYPLDEVANRHRIMRVLAVSEIEVKIVRRQDFVEDRTATFRRRRRFELWCLGGSLRGRRWACGPGPGKVLGRAVVLDRRADAGREQEEQTLTGSHQVFGHSVLSHRLSHHIVSTVEAGETPALEAGETDKTGEKRALRRVRQSSGALGLGIIGHCSLPMRTRTQRCAVSAS